MPALRSILPGLLALALTGCLEADKSGGSPSPADRPSPAPRSSAAALAPEAPKTPTPEAPAPDSDTKPLGTPDARFIDGPTLLREMVQSGRKATIVNIWASWCGPCRDEVPMLIALRQNLEQKGVGVTIVSVDEAEAAPVAAEFARLRGEPMPIRVAQPPLGAFKQALSPRWPGMVPATFLFDGTGRLRYFWGGPVFENEILPVVEGLLAGKDIDGEARFDLLPGKEERP